MVQKMVAKRKRPKQRTEKDQRNLERKIGKAWRLADWKLSAQDVLDKLSGLLPQIWGDINFERMDETSANAGMLWFMALYYLPGCPRKFRAQARRLTRGGVWDEEAIATHILLAKILDDDAIEERYRTFANSFTTIIE